MTGSTTPSTTTLPRSATTSPPPTLRGSAPWPSSTSTWVADRSARPTLLARVRAAQILTYVIKGSRRFARRAHHGRRKNHRNHLQLERKHRSRGPGRDRQGSRKRD